MTRSFFFLFSVVVILAALPAARALTPKPNVAPVVTSAISSHDQYKDTTGIIDLNPYFKDPDASAAMQLNTSLGVMNFTLDGETAPLTVANFLRYVNEGRYFVTDPAAGGAQASLFFHRSVPGFIIQSGGYFGTLNPNGSGSPLVTQVAAFGPVPNEPFISNTRATIAMAKLGGDPNSATSQWFINLADNSANLDNQNGGFTVFGRVAGQGVAVVDAIAALPIYNAGSPFNELPVRNYTSPNAVRVQNFVSIPGFAQVSPLVYSASSNNDGVATVSASGTDLLVKGNSVGTAQITVTATDLDGAAASQSFTVTISSAPARLTNISSRAKVAAGDQVLIGGFIVRGGSSKTLVMRALGPSLAQYGITNPIADPAVSLHNTSTMLSQNDDWRSGPRQQLLSDLKRAPERNSEAALIATVPSGAGDSSYTAIMRNNTQATGVGIMEIYDLDSSAGSTLRNLSSRGLIGTGDDIMIGGFIISGDGTRRIVARGVGPSLTQYGVTGVLPNPVIDLRDGNGNRITVNDDWQTNSPADVAEIRSYQLDPGDPNEAAVIATLSPGNYTALLSGSGSQPTGTALLEIYDVP